MATFVLVHGAWHGAWCWERLIPLLEAKGHTCLAPDLPGMGSDKTSLQQASLARWATFIAEIVFAQQEPVILVGHSRAGIVISQAAEIAHERVSGLVYLAAFLVQNGQTLQQVMQQMPPREEASGALEFTADGRSSTIAKAAFERVFYNTSDAPTIARAASLSGPEPISSFTTPLAVTQDGWGRLPRFYIHCCQDRAIALDLQRNMVAASPCNRTYDIDSDHSPFYSAPTVLAEHLDAVADELAEAGNAS